MLENHHAKQFDEMPRLHGGWGFALVLAVLVVGVVGCEEGTVASRNGIDRGSDPKRQIPSGILNMPMNQGDNCFAISLAVESILDARSERVSTNVSISSLAKEIYADRSPRTTELPEHVTLKGVKCSIDSKPAVAALANAIHELYVLDHRQLVEMGNEYEWLEAVRTSFELDKLLADDADHIGFFLGVGTREFPDGQIEPSYHAFLIGKDEGKYFVVDSNEPGTLYPCDIKQSKDGVVATWSCKYRDSAAYTTQTYRFADRDRFFLGLDDAVRTKEPYERGDGSGAD